jgi:hypothetical protein
MRNTTTFMLKEIESRMRNIVISLKEIKFQKCRDVIIFFEESIANESRFQMFVIEFIIVRMMILKQSTKRRALFRKCKFDVSIESI